jgi:hypothetical protein
LVSANANMKTAFASLRTPLKNEGDYVKVMLRIKYDDDDKGDGKGTHTKYLVLNEKLSLTFKEDAQVMFAIPYFNIMAYQYYKEEEKIKKGEPKEITRNRPFHCFVVKQLSYPS